MTQPKELLEMVKTLISERLTDIEIQMASCQAKGTEASTCHCVHLAGEKSALHLVLDLILTHER